jgi:hypothetical protein
MSRSLLVRRASHVAEKPWVASEIIQYAFVIALRWSRRIQTGNGKRMSERATLDGSAREFARGAAAGAV